MYCLNCGKELADNAKFCPGCGKPTGSAPQPKTPPVHTPPPSAPKPAKKRGGALVAVVAVVLVVALVAVLVLTGAFAGPKGKVGNAFLKSAKAYQESAEIFGKMPEADAYRKISQTIELGLVDVGDVYNAEEIEMLEGFGVRLNSNLDLDGRKWSIVASVLEEEEALLNAQLVLDDAEIYLGCPELLDEEFYGINTMTLGADLDDLGVDVGDMDEFGFNIFELVEITEEMTQIDDEAIKKAMTAAGKDLWSAVEVEKGDKESVDVNDNKVDCTAYTVIIPQDALEDFADAVRTALEDATESVDYEALMERLLEAMGMPNDMIDEALDSMGSMDMGDMYDEVFDGVEMVLDELGDIELEVYVNGGYVMAVNYELDLDGTEVQMGVYMGGGKNYVDDFSIVLENPDADAEIILTSTGDHAAKGGVYTDETVLEMVEDGETYIEFFSEMSYDTKAKEENLTWSMEAEEYGESIVALNVTGQVAFGEEMVLDLGEVEIEVDGESMTFRVYYAQGKYDDAVKVGSATMLTDMDEDDLYDLGEDVMNNAMEWAEDLDLMGASSSDDYYYDAPAVEEPAADAPSDWD